MEITSKYIKKEIVKILTEVLHLGSPRRASEEQLYKACAIVLRKIAEKKRRAFLAECNARAEKQVYYLSMEFLMGKSFRNFLCNLGLRDKFAEALEEYSTTPEKLYRFEPDPGLGNGGLGRLAACYLDGLATDGYLATGYSILYEYGIFRQKISDGWQSELPDYWLPGGDCWLKQVAEHSVEVRFGGELSERWECGRHTVEHTGYTKVMAIPYNMYVTGYNSQAVSLLRLWQAKSTGMDMDLFNKGDYLGAFGKNSYAETISKVLYPNDNHIEGKLLRLRQQYFMAAAAMGDIFRRHLSIYGKLENFADKNVIHINDTHPTLAIPEMLRLMLDEYGYSWEKSWDTVIHTFAYTNHTVLSEALESWDSTLFSSLLPRIYQIIKEIDKREERFLREKGISSDVIRRMAVINDGKIRMANLCVTASRHVNGVSALHTEIIKEDIFSDFYKLTPAKFVNVTNGIASRRWLIQANPLLTEFIKELIGDAFLKDFEKLEELRKFSEDAGVLSRLAQIKISNKRRFCDKVKSEYGCDIDPESIFYVQAKRLHEYKRQHLNALEILSLYLDIKRSPNMDFPPRTYIFGAKAAPGYYLAKQIIKFICDLASLIDKDPDVRGRLKIYFIEEYNVSKTEILMPAAEVSQQISLAGKEASGTGNMKLMLNGAITLGTLDGANVEIAQLAGRENILLFGLKADEAKKLAYSGYRPEDFIKSDGRLAETIEYMEKNTRFASFGGIAKHLREKDDYMALADYTDYVRADNLAAEIYFTNNRKWQKMSLENIAGSGYFCADRAIREYAAQIWGLD